MEAQAQRQTAIKIRIGDLKSSRYTKTDGDWEPNYALTPYNTKVSRVNIMGAVVSSEDGNSFVLDDGTANIVVRSFEPISVPEIGDITVVIGRIREFSEQIYVIPEIVKKIEKNIESWLKLRKLELDALYDHLERSEIEKMEQPAKIEKIEPTTEKVEEIMEPVKETKKPDTEEPKEKPENDLPDKTAAANIFDKVLETIKSMDTGDGADVQEVVDSSGYDEAEVENVVNNLLMDGEAFEIKPGRIKLLD